MLRVVIVLEAEGCEIEGCDGRGEDNKEDCLVGLRDVWAVGLDGSGLEPDGSEKIGCWISGLCAAEEEWTGMDWNEGGDWTEGGVVWSEEAD